MSEASPKSLGPIMPTPEAAPAAPVVPARSFDEMPLGFEDAFDPAARVAKLEAALSANEYLAGRPTTDHLDLTTDARRALDDGSDNPHFGHTTIVRETPDKTTYYSPTDGSYVRSLDTPAVTWLADMPKDSRVEYVATSSSFSSLRDRITKAREDVATAQGTHTETVTRAKKDGAKIVEKKVTIGPDKTAEVDAQDRLDDSIDALGVKLARSGMSDERVLETLISLNEGTPAFRRKIGEKKSGKAKYETVEAKPGLNLSEEEMTQVLDALTRTQDQIQADNSMKAAIEQSVADGVEPTPEQREWLTNNYGSGWYIGSRIGETGSVFPWTPAAPAKSPAKAGPAVSRVVTGPSRTAPRTAAPAEKPVAAPTPEELKAKFEEDVKAAKAELQAEFEKTGEDVTPRDFLMSAFESKIKAHLLVGKETQAFVKKPMAVAIKNLLNQVAKAESAGEDEKYKEIMSSMTQEIAQITERVRTEVAPKRFGSGLLKAVGLRRPKKPKAPKAPKARITV